VPPNPTHQVDDVLLAIALDNGGQSHSISAGQGWGQIHNSLDVNFGCAAWVKRCAGSSEPDPTITWGGPSSASQAHVANVFRIRGVPAGLSPPYEPVPVVVNGAPTSSNRPKWGPITTLGPDRLVVAIAMVDDDSGWTNTFSAGWTEVTQIASALGGDVAYTVISHDQAAADTLAQGDFVQTPFTMTLTAYWQTLTLAFPGVAPLAGGGSLAMMGLGR
jgi:hypothetical protein